MILSRVAIEGQDGVIRLTVLCAGCAAQILARVHVETPTRRVWSRQVTGPGASCEFCIGEAVAAL